MMIGTKHEMNALKKSRLAKRMPTGAPRSTKKRLPNACAERSCFSVSYSLTRRVQ